MAHVLVMDDDSGFRTTLERMLGRLGHDVILTSSGREGLEYFREHGADIVLVDAYMPDGDGIETMAQLQAEAPGTPVVLVSGGGFLTRDEVLRLGTRLGAFATIGKPFSLEQLQTVLDAELTAADGMARTPRAEP
jgi:two-component system nitrogen regulation response regulator NtrX